MISKFAKKIYYNKSDNTFERTSRKNNYYSDIQCKANYKMAIQKGICNWIVGNNNENLEILFEILEKWSVQTYEGKKVTFGFIINPEEKSDFDNTNGTWCDFLRDDFSAVFTDCINTVIELDGACIIDMSGNVCACGAIIKNDSGSTGGGRGAASKKLSRYGFAIKISTDGYIELYIDGNQKYAIK